MNKLPKMGAASLPEDGARAALSGAILNHLRNTAFPGAEIVMEGTPGDGSAYYWILAPYGTESSAWVVPVEARYGAAFLGKWHPAQHHSYWSELAAAYADGSLGGRYGVHLLRVPADRNAYWAQFGWRSSIPPVVVAYLGSPRRWQKVVAGLVQRETGWPSMVVKFPLVRSARQYILDEAETLKALAAVRPGIAPRPLFLDEARAIATEEALQGDEAGELLQPLHLPFVCALVDPDSMCALSDYGNRLRVRADKLDLDKAMKAALDRVSVLLDDDAQLPGVWVHGDLHAGNMVLRANGQVRAVDWAFARRGGLPFHDIARARLAGALAKPDAPLDAKVDRQCLDAYATALGVSPALYPRLIAWYTARTMLRHVEQGDEAEARVVTAKLKAWTDAQEPSGR